jgi:hypothetical protein
MTRYDDYIKDVDAVLAAFLSVRGPDSILWATMNPRPLPRRCEKEWRFLDLIERFNEGARDAAKTRDVAVWDTFDVLRYASISVGLFCHKNRPLLTLTHTYIHTSGTSLT